MVTIFWSELALKDLEAIHDYIAKDSKLYAKNFSEKLISRVEQLQLFPESGRVVPELGLTTIRELIEGNYRIIYRNNSEEIEIVRIHHSARILSTI
jgi:toxin ParE1/3/4